jgi:ribonuclease HII
LEKKFIERFNIHNVVLQSMKQSIILLSKKSDTIIIDGKFIPSEMKGYKVKSLIKADDKINQVSAASIIAKVFRDKLLLKLHSLDGNYQWNKNAGYGTKSHLSAIYTHGVSKYHRTTYQPISKLIKKLST